MESLRLKAAQPDQIRYTDKNGKIHWKVTPDGKLRGPVVNRAIAMFFSAGFLGGLLGSVVGRLM